MLDAVDLRIERGELFGLIGPDGAGKRANAIVAQSLNQNDRTRPADLSKMAVVRQYARARDDGRSGDSDVIEGQRRPCLP